MDQSKIEITAEWNAIAIRFGGVLHLWVDRQRLIAINSWIADGGKEFFIEFVLDSGSFTLDYDDRSLWEAVLIGLDGILTQQKETKNNTKGRAAGGHARAAAMTAEERKICARNAAKARWSKLSIG